MAIPVWLALIPLAAQTTSQEPVFRISVDLVQVDAVVTDAKGRHIPNLEARDFEVLEDGKPQKIVSLSYVPGAGHTPAIVARSRSNRPDASRPIEPQLPPRALRKDQVQRTVVLIADDLGLSADDIPRVRSAMKSFVNEHFQPGDLVSIMTTSGGTGTAQHVTNDKRQLLSLIDHLHYVAGRVGQTWYEPVHKIDAASEFENQSKARLNAIRRPFLGSGTMNALYYAIEGLREMPGRKAVALFSDGFPHAASRIVEVADRASVVIYTLDPRGLPSFALTAVDFCRPPLCNPQAEESHRQRAYIESQKGLEQLAKGTGGIFFHDNNDLKQGLENAIDDLSDYYLIAWQPHREDFETVRGTPPFHRIEVKLLTPGLTVRSRNGFFGIADPAPLSRETADPSPQEALAGALRSPFQAAGFPVKLSAFYSASVARDPKTHRHGTALRAMLAIDAHHIQFADASGGGKSLKLEVAAAVYGPDNDVVARSDRTFTDVITSQEMLDLVASGLAYGLDIDIPKAGPHQLRIAVWDANARRTASASTFAEIPDFNGPDPALSSLLISSSDRERNAVLTRTGVIGAGNAVTRVFGFGANLTYDCTLFGGKIDRRTGKPQIEIQVRLFRGAELVFTGHRIPLLVADGNSPEAVHITGEIKLPGTLAPGDYAVELIAYDRLRPGKSATQWTGFTLMPVGGYGPPGPNQARAARPSPGR